jgi:hypothetical protein
VGKPDNLDSLEKDIEATRERLAATIDQLAYRASPKTVARREVASVQAVYVDAAGRPRTDNMLKTAAVVVGVIAAMLVMRKLTR